jgi:RNA polymerase sigma-70 factor (ECF subfamily)
VAKPPAGPIAAALRDEVLAGQARQGDLAALASLLARWQEPILRFCRRMLRHDEDSRDLTQEALLRVTQALSKYDDTRPFAPWIYRIARNSCLNHIERERLRTAPPPPETAPAATPPPDLLIARREEVARVRAALARLGPADRSLLQMKLVMGLTNAEIAARLGLGAGALRTRACRALARLRVALGRGSEEAKP